ncbi:MAG: S49 family peptidase [Pseudomonadales bacterium]|nr:S49 family peptidase [Pseudomonadales bacterium]
MSDNQSDYDNNNAGRGNRDQGGERNDNRGNRGGNRGGGRRGGGQRRPQNQKEWKLIEKMLSEQFQESKKSRRWGMVFKMGILAYMFVALFVFKGGFSGDVGDSAKPHTALVDVKGMIADGYEANADAIVVGLRKAFEAENSKAVVIRINSPGGSPVQSGMVYREILRLRGEYEEKKVYAVITDVGASGAYYIAAAADEIYADQASIVGSIGVISDGFGFVDALQKLGIERRIYNAGDNKAMLDPFSPQDESQTEFFQSVLTAVHDQFIKAVKDGRGERLKDTEQVFSGLMWSGEQALPLGLIDGLGSPGYVAREVIQEEVIVDYTRKVSPFQSFADRLGVKIGSTIVELMGLGQFNLR